MNTLQTNFNIFRVAARNSFSELTAEYSLNVFMFTMVPRFIFQAIFFVLMAGFAGGPELLRFALIGNAVQLIANMGLTGLTSIVESEKWLGTLTHMIAVPGNRALALTGRGIANITMALSGVFIAFLATLLIFDVQLSVVTLLYALPIVLMIAFTMMAAGLFMGAIALPYRIGTLVSNAASYVMMIICGVNFPLDALPEFLQAIAQVLPMTNGLIAVRQVIDGASLGSVSGLIGWEFMLGVIYAALGYVLFDWRLAQIRKTGKMDLF